jgi:hypothetical protein
MPIKGQPWEKYRTLSKKQLKLKRFGVCDSSDRAPAFQARVPRVQTTLPKYHQKKKKKKAM